MAERKTAMVAGGTGGIGEGIVRTLVQAGWTVHVPARDPEKAAKLRASLAGAADWLEVQTVDLSDSGEVTAYRKSIQQTTPPLDLVVVSVGSSYYGYSLHKLPAQDWQRLLTENIATHFNLQKEFLALLHEQNTGTYVTLTGPEADFAHPETGLMSILAAAQKMMARVEAMEAAGTGVRVYSVTSKTPIATAARGAQSGSDWIHPEELGSYVQGLADKTVPGTGEPLHLLESRDHLQKLLKLR